MHRIVTQLLNTFLEHLPVYFYVIDENFNLTYLHNFQNDRWYIGSPTKCYQQIFHLEKPCRGCILSEETVVDNPQKFLLQMPSTSRSLQLLTYNYTVAPVQMGTDMRHFILYRNDISDSNRLMSQLQQLDRYAINDQLSSEITHEVRNMINGITGMLDIMDIAPDPETRLDELNNNIAQLRTELKAVSLLLGNLQTVGRSVSSTKTVVVLNQVIEDVITLMRKKIRDKQITIDLLADSDNILMLGNETGLKLLLLNLLLNSWHALPYEGKIQIRLKLHNDIVQILIVDNGRGIDPERLSQIFTPFYTTKEEKEGTGLGLSTAIKIAEAHGGYIDIISEPQNGTAAFVMLPLGSIDPCWKIKTTCQPPDREKCPVYQRGIVTQCWIYTSECSLSESDCSQCEVYEIKNQLPNLPPRPSTSTVKLQSCWEL